MIGKKRVVQILIISAVIIAFTFHYSLFSQEEQSEEDAKTEALFKMSLEELMNVKITTADKTAERIADIPASSVLITREDIEMYGYQTLTEILENIPGLYGINDYMKGGTNFGVRGFWSGHPNDNMVILVNGVHQVYDILSSYPLNNIAVPVEGIERIEVIRGPMSVIYGNGAFYGAINIITTKEPQYDPLNILSGSVGSEKTKKLFLRAAGETDDFYYVFNASLYDTYGIDKPLRDMVSNPAFLPFYGVPEDSRTGGKLENNEKYFNFAGTFKGFFLNLSYNETKSEFYFNLPSVANGTYARNNTIHISFGYRKELSDIVTLEGKFTYSKTREWQKFDVLFEDFYGVQNFETNAYELELNTIFKPNDDLKILTGLYYRTVLHAYQNYDLPSFGNPFFENTDIYVVDDDNIITRALFTQITYSPLDSLRLVAGVRLEQTPKYGLEQFQVFNTGLTTIKLSGSYDREKIDIIPRLAAIYYLNEDHIFKFLYGQAINRPSFFQNLENSLLFTKYGDLQPESIQTFELNYIASLSSNLTLNLSIFHNTLENLITRVVEFNPQTSEYESGSSNAGKMVTNGIELTVNTEFFDHFRIELSGIFQKTKDKRDGYENIDVAYSPKILGYLKASFRSGNFTLALTGNYVGSMESFWDEIKANPDGSVGGRIGEKVDGYFVLGANLRIEDVLLRGLFLNVRCSNLLDEEIRYPTFTNNPYLDKGTLGYGRTFLVSLGYYF